MHTHIFVTHSILHTGLLYPWYVIIIPMYYMHPYFSLKKLEQEVHIIHSIIRYSICSKLEVLWFIFKNADSCSAPISLKLKNTEEVKIQKQGRGHCLSSINTKNLSDMFIKMTIIIKICEAQSAFK